jgi:hypothetical protein
MLPTLVTFMAIYCVAVWIIEEVVSSGSVVLRAAASAAGIALVWAAWRSRPVRTAVQILKNRPRVWWMRMLVIQSCVMVVFVLVTFLLRILKHGGPAAR